jgi:hypothetical protein
VLAYLDRAARAGGLEPFGGVGEPWERAATADGTGTPLLHRLLLADLDGRGVLSEQRHHALRGILT